MINVDISPPLRQSSNVISSSAKISLVHKNAKNVLYHKSKNPEQIFNH